MIVEPEKKAEELIYRFQNECISDEEDKGINFVLAKQCSLIAVDLILNYDNCHRNDYWGEVKLEILKK
jgi:hypothetical protein